MSRKILFFGVMAVFCLPDIVSSQENNEIILPDTVGKTISVSPVYKRQDIEISEDKLIHILDAQPSFAVYKDVFIVTGIPLHEKITRNTADAMFQLSVRQRITKSKLPFNTFAYITYTQKSFWNVYAKSCPFRDNNYNPGIGLGKYIIKDNKLKGTFFAQIEHESNGKDSLESRSWNYLSFAIKYFYNPRLALGAEIWIPYVDGENNKDLLDYRGLGVFSINYISPKHKWWFAAELNPRKGFGNVNTTLTVAFQVSKNHNQYLYARFYNGKGDSLIDYNKYEMNIRFGFCIKPDFHSAY